MLSVLCRMYVRVVSEEVVCRVSDVGCIPSNHTYRIGHQNTAALEARVASAEETIGNVAIGVDTMWLLITVRLMVLNTPNDKDWYVKQRTSSDRISNRLKRYGCNGSFSDINRCLLSVYPAFIVPNLVIRRHGRNGIKSSFVGTGRFTVGHPGLVNPAT
jgi:hypothetical protein